MTIISNCRFNDDVDLLPSTPTKVAAQEMHLYLDTLLLLRRIAVAFRLTFSPHQAHRRLTIVGKFHFSSSLYKTLQLCWRDEHHFSTRYSLSWCFESWRAQGSSSVLHRRLVGLRSGDREDHITSFSSSSKHSMSTHGLWIGARPCWKKLELSG